MSLIKQMGQFPDNERRMFFETLPNYKNGQFHNLIPTPALAEGEKMGKVLWTFLKTKYPDTRPKKGNSFCGYRSEESCAGRKCDGMVWTQLLLYSTGWKKSSWWILFSVAMLRLYRAL